MAEKKTLLLLVVVLLCGIVLGYALFSIAFSSDLHPQKQVIFTARAPVPVGPYSQAVSSGELVFISGQIGIDPATGIIPATIDGQTVQVMENIGAVLREADLSFPDVIQSRIYLTNESDWVRVNEIYGHYFEGGYPARATVFVKGLPKGAVVEIEVIAKRS